MPRSSARKTTTMDDHLANLQARIQGVFEQSELSREQRHYLDVSISRFAFVVRTVARVLAERTADSQMRVLDVGPHFLTVVLKQFFREAINLDTLGWKHSSLVPEGTATTHTQFDLNLLREEKLWPNLPQSYDLVVVAEVIEHLHASPHRTLRFLRSVMAKEGVLLLQTPNAVSLRKRLRMLVGRHPYEMFRDGDRQSGHLREYTAAELRDVCVAEGFACERVLFPDYWPEHGLLRLAEKLVPSWRRGMTLIAHAR